MTGGAAGRADVVIGPYRVQCNYENDRGKDSSLPLLFYLPVTLLYSAHKYSGVASGMRCWVDISSV